MILRSLFWNKLPASTNNDVPKEGNENDAFIFNRYYSSNNK
jgi:hypothetical protein